MNDEKKREKKNKVEKKTFRDGEFRSSSHLDQNQDIKIKNKTNGWTELNNKWANNAMVMSQAPLPDKMHEIKVQVFEVLSCFSQL